MSVTVAAATDQQPMISPSSVLVRIGVFVALHVGALLGLLTLL